MVIYDAGVSRKLDFDFTQIATRATGAMLFPHKYLMWRIRHNTLSVKRNLSLLQGDAH